MTGGIADAHAIGSELRVRAVVVHRGGAVGACRVQRGIRQRARAARRARVGRLDRLGALRRERGRDRRGIAVLDCRRVRHVDDRVGREQLEPGAHVDAAGLCQAAALLEELDGRLGLRAEDAVGGDVQRALHLSDRRVVDAEREQHLVALVAAQEVLDVRPLLRRGRRGGRADARGERRESHGGGDGQGGALATSMALADDRRELPAMEGALERSFPDLVRP